MNMPPRTCESSHAPSPDIADDRIKAVENTFAHYDQAIKNEDANLQKYYATWNKRGVSISNQLCQRRAHCPKLHSKATSQNPL